MAGIKTGFLICLVALSIILSALLMSGRPSNDPHVLPEEVWFGPEPALHEVALPGRVFVIFHNREAHLVQTFSRMYKDLILAFAQTQYGEDMGGDLWTPGEYPMDAFPPGVLLRYDFQVSRGLLAGWLTMFYETDFPFATIDSIFIPLDQGPVQFINSASREVWQLQANLTWDVFERAVTEPRDILEYAWRPMRSGENFTVASGVYQITKPETIVIPQWAGEEINYNTLIRSFYLEPSLIQEPDGTEIYTDGLQALRIFPSGALEYTTGRVQSGSSLPRQTGLMEAAMSFISSHGGWPGNMLPTFFGLSSQSVRVEFSVFGLGLPIVGSTGITVEAEGPGISFLTRDIVNARTDVAVDYVEIKPLSVHLAAPETQVAQYFNTVSIGEIISDISLSYYWNQDQLIPVWRVWVGRRIICVGASDGRVINVRTLSGGD